jgi:hypothetical protein
MSVQQKDKETDLNPLVKDVLGGKVSLHDAFRDVPVNYEFSLSADNEYERRVFFVMSLSNGIANHFIDILKKEYEGICD